MELHQEVRQALTEVRGAVESGDCRALLLTGNGRGFCAGQDLSDRNVAPGDEMPDLGYSIETYYNPLIRTLTALPVPVVCGERGVRLGGRREAHRAREGGAPPPPPLDAPRAGALHL